MTHTSLIVSLAAIAALTQSAASGCDAPALFEEIGAIRTLFDRGEHKQANRSLENLWKRARTCPPEMKLYTAVADISLMLRRTKEATRFAETGEAEALRQQGADSLERAVALETLTQARAQQRRYADAEPLIREAMRIVDLHGGEVSYLKASMYNTLGNLHAELEDIEGAQRQLDRAWSILQALPPCPFRAVVLHNLAAAAMRQGREQEASARINEALALSETVSPNLRKRLEDSRSIQALRPPQHK